MPFILICAKLLSVKVFGSYFRQESFFIGLRVVFYLRMAYGVFNTFLCGKIKQVAGELFEICFNVLILVCLYIANSYTDP